MHAAACGVCRHPAAGGCTLRRAGTRPSRGEGQKGTGHQGFLSPLATPQLSFEPRLPAVARLKTRRARILPLCSPFSVGRGSAIAGCAAHDSARPVW